MTRDQCVFLAKKLYVELVYNTAYIEGVNVTFPQTQTILDGGIVNNVAVDDIQTVLNLRDGWKFVLGSIDQEITLDYLCKVNEFISRNESLAWGVLRTGSVWISGTDYLPAIPEQRTVESRLHDLNAISDPLERALETFCFCVRSQLFWDGNKRTATMVASKILIEHAIGVLTIDAKHALQFNEGLLHFYDTDDKTALKGALENCVKTMAFPLPSLKEKLEIAREKCEQDNHIQEQTDKDKSHSEPER